MTPEEKYNRDKKFVLEQIREKELYSLKSPALEHSHMGYYREIPKGVQYRVKITPYSQLEKHPPSVQISIIRQLAEEGAIKIIDEENATGYGAYYWFLLEIIRPKFDELYKKYELANSSKETEQLVKPILRKLENGKLPYKKDGLFYSLWKYANASRLMGKSLIAFMDLVPLEGNPRFAILDFLNGLQELKIELEDITFDEDIYKKYCKAEHDYITDYIAKNSKADFSKAIEKLFKNKATFNDIYRILGKFDELAKIKMQLNGLLEFVEFSPSPSVKNIKPLKEYLETYINCFVGDKLFSPELKNFYKFSRQKDVFLQQIEREVKDYGLEFVFRQGEIISVSRGSGATIGKDEAYLFIHALAAMEKQEYFEIESIMITDMDVPPEKQTDDYKIKILANEKLLEEYEPKVSRAHEHIQKIQIVDSKLKVDGLKDGLNTIAQSKKEDSKLKFPHKLPAGTKWQNFVIKFLDDEKIYIQVKQFKHTANFKEMRMVGKGKKPNPSEAWTFLKVLAGLNGELTIKDSEAKDKYKKQKELLSKDLQNYFSIDYDPFYPYQSSPEKIGNSYKVKFTLMSPEDKKDENGETLQEQDDLGIKEYLDEQAPMVNDEQ